MCRAKISSSPPSRAPPIASRSASIISEEKPFILDYQRVGAAPPNDNFGAAQSISGANGSVAGSSLDATKEPGETTVGGASIWYRWTAPASGPAQFSTQGSDFDTILSIYSSNGTSLTLVASDDDGLAPRSLADFTATMGTVYYIAISGKITNNLADSGQAMLAWTLNDTSQLAVDVTPQAFAENVANGSVTGTVTRSGSLTGDLAVSLTVNIENGAQPRLEVPPIVTIPDGQATATFPVSGRDNTLSEGDQNATIRARALGYTSGTFAATVTDDDVPTLTLTGATDLTEGSSVVLTVTRSTGTTAPLTVNLAANPNKVTVPATITIPINQSSVTFTATRPNDNLAEADFTSTISATQTGFVSSNLTLNVHDDEPAALSIAPTTVAPIIEGQSATLTVHRNTPTTGALVVTLSSSDTGTATVPANVTIADGQADATFAVNAVDNTLTEATRSATITASATGHNAATRSVQVLDNDTPGIVLSKTAISIDESGQRFFHRRAANAADGERLDRLFVEHERSDGCARDFDFYIGELECAANRDGQRRGRHAP